MGWPQGQILIATTLWFHLIQIRLIKNLANVCKKSISKGNSEPFIVTGLDMINMNAHTHSLNLKLGMFDCSLDRPNKKVMI